MTAPAREGTPGTFQQKSPGFSKKTQEVNSQDANFRKTRQGEFVKQLILSSSFVLSLSLAGSALAAEIYRWVDIYGNVYYTDSKPVGVTSEQIEVNVPEEGLVLIEPTRRNRQAAQPRPDTGTGAAAGAS